MSLYGLLLCVYVLLTFGDVTVDAATATVNVNGTSTVHLTNKRYLSFGMDSNTMRYHWGAFDFKSTRLKTLAKALAPAYLRLSGTDADFVIFNRSVSDKAWRVFPDTNFTMTVSDWDNINQWVAAVGWDLMYGVNAQLRMQGANGTTTWDPSNAIELLAYSVKRGYNKHLNFQLGNEPDRYYIHHLTVLTGAEMARDFIELHDILHRKFAGFFNQSVIVGPDMSRTDVTASIVLLRDFINTLTPGVVDGIDFHHCYGGDSHSITSFIDPARFDAYRETVASIQHTVASSKQPQVPLWNSEAGVSGGDTGTGYETKFDAAFQLMEHLGTSANMGLHVVMRQTFYGLWLGLINDHLEPNPPYWIALLYKQLVDREVLAVNVTGLTANQNQLRLYAHCTSRSYVTANKLAPGAVTVFGMNLYSDDVIVNFGSTDVDLYLLTSNALDSTNTWLNGVPLYLTADDALPDLQPVRVGGAGVIMPSRSLAFVVIPGAQAQACV